MPSAIATTTSTLDAPTKPKEPITRTTLFSATGRDAARKVDTEMKRLEAEYLRVFKRRLNPSVLSIGSWGQYPNTSVGLTAYTTEDQAADLFWLRTNVAKPTTAVAVTELSLAR